MPKPKRDRLFTWKETQKVRHPNGEIEEFDVLLSAKKPRGKPIEPTPAAPQTPQPAPQTPAPPSAADKK
jgi:hypothetical protein